MSARSWVSSASTSTSGRAVAQMPSAVEPKAQGNTKAATSAASCWSRTSDRYRREARPVPRRSLRTLNASWASAPERRNAIGEMDSRQLDLVRHHLAHFTAERVGDVARGRGREGRIGGDRPEVAFDGGQCRIAVEVAGDGQDRVVRRVIGREEAAHVVERGGRQVLHRPDRRVVVRVPDRPDELLHPLLGGAVRLVVDRQAPLVLHDVPLVVELFLGHGRQEAGHPVRLQPQGQLQLVRWQGVEVVRPIGPGRGVQRASGGLDEGEVLALGHVLGALEHHVLEQVREPGPARLLVAAADVVPQVDRHDRRPSIGGQEHPQAVVQPKALNRNVGHGASQVQELARRTGSRRESVPDAEVDDW